MISERDDAVRRAQALEAAAEAADRAVWQADADCEAAGRALQEARDGLADRALAIAAGEVLDGPGPVQAARERLAAAEAALVDARLSRDALRARLQQPGHGHTGLIDMRVHEAAVAVLAAEVRPHAARVLAQVEAAERDVIRLGRELVWLARHGGFETSGEPGGAYGYPADDQTRAVVRRCEPGHRGRDDLQNWPVLRGEAAWEQALQALKHDATALLPVTA
ncbi:hypothetical protein [Lichenicoccus roseus]|uniref:hypothetical protein n=1 Tax=Lichenicoccus roseus TaxID=2683649 RepID=UPI001106D073|nr:hypothetical protein [Lichenicoccus roseus]